MKKTIILLAIIFLSSAANAQLKSRDFQFEKENTVALNTSSSNEVKSDLSGSKEYIKLNNLGAKKALEEKDYNQAIVFFNKALELEPNCSVCRYNVGRSYLKLGKLDEAIDIFNQVVEKNPDYADAHSSLGEVLSEKTKYKESLSSFENALKIKF